MRGAAYLEVTFEELKRRGVISGKEDELLRRAAGGGSVKMKLAELLRLIGRYDESKGRKRGQRGGSSARSK